MSLSQQQDGLTISLAGKVVLVTGGSRGIGAATVRVLRKAGARVVFSYRSAAEQAETLVAECGGAAACRAVQQALATAEDGQALVGAAREVFGRLDAVVINHGVWPPHDQPIDTMPTAQWRSTLGINLDSVFGIVQAASAQMLAQGPGPRAQGTAAEPGAPHLRPREMWAETQRDIHGHIVLIASTAAQRGEAYHADYAASKGALISLTKSLSSELAPKGILCNCVAPGWVRTEMSAGTLSDPDASKRALGLIPLGRAAEPEEIAGPVAFLLSPWAGFISGEIWNVNGGAVLVG